jgi:hypothetical protein
LVTVVDYAAYADSFVVGWILIDCLANLFVASGQRSTTIRFFGAQFITRDRAIILSVAQIILAMVVSYYIVDWIFGQLTIFLPYIIPITLGTFGIFYAYVLLGLPYKIRTRSR